MSPPSDHHGALPSRDRIFAVYEEFDTAHIRALRQFVDLFPPLDFPVALQLWDDVRNELDERTERIRTRYPDHGDLLVMLTSTTTRDEALVALDRYQVFGRAINVLVLDVDETLRSAGLTDNEISRETLHAIIRFYEGGVPVVICTGQTLENVKGFAIQGFGSEVVHSGAMSIVYEAGTGVFTPGHGPKTKQLLYEGLGADVQTLFGELRSRVLREAPDAVRNGCHLQGNEFNVTVKPNYETGSAKAKSVIDTALIHELDLLGAVVAETIEGVDAAPETVANWARAYYAAADPEIRGVLADRDAQPEADREAVPGHVTETFDRIDVAYYEADAAEIGSRDLDKPAGVRAAFDVLDIDEPFALVMGDSKSDHRVMRFVANQVAGIAAAPAHASPGVLEHVRSHDGIVFEPGQAHRPLQTMYAMTMLARADGAGREY